MGENLTRGFGLLENFLARKRAKMADKLIPKELREGRILDIGCGNYPYFLINTHFKEKFGIDRIVSHNFKDITLKSFDIATHTRLPFQDNFFDVIAILAVVEHIEPEKLVNVLRECNRTLKRGGRLIITTPVNLKLLRLMSKFRLISPKEIEEHKVVYHPTELVQFLEQANFKEVNFGYFEFCLNSWVYANKT